MSDFLLEKICTYLKQREIIIRFNITQCIEKDIYSMTVFNSEGVFLNDFDIRKGDMDVIKLVAEIENFKDVILN